MAELFIYMNGIKVGTLYRNTSGAHSLEYNNTWLSHPLRRPLSLSLPLKPGITRGPEVINYFDNLLPDNQAIRDRIVARMKAKSRQPFDILTAIGRDAVGAISLLPEPLRHEERTLKYHALSEQELYLHLTAYTSGQPLGMLREEDDFRISLAGAQEKTALLKLPDGKWCRPNGTTPTTHILKLPIGEIKGPNTTLDLSDSVENEWLCLQLAKELGFNVPNAEIITVGNAKALAVERFDRKWNDNQSWITRLPQEDFCQAMGLSSGVKYEADGGPGVEQIMRLLMGSSNALADRESFMRFQVFQWLIGATDGHAKNFSIFIDAGGSYRLTPFYDILSAFGVLGGKGFHSRKLKLAMGLHATKGKKRDITLLQPRHFLASAKATGFPVVLMENSLLTLANAMPAAIEQVDARANCLIPKTLRVKIFSNTMKMVKRVLLDLDN